MTAKESFYNYRKDFEQSDTWQVNDKGVRGKDLWGRINHQWREEIQAVVTMMNKL